MVCFRIFFIYCIAQRAESTYSCSNEIGNAAYKPIPHLVLVKIRENVHEEPEDEKNGAKFIIEKSAKSSNVRFQIDTFSRLLSGWYST